MQCATAYKNELGLDIADGYLFDTWTSEQEFFGSYKADDERREKAMDYDKIRSTV
jgi:hypothetical protein